jgi:1-deoxy-D-xylulose-5-phosphate reductoisomerase
MDMVQVVVQPQSIIHSMVEFVDGGIIAQLGTPDMKLPIQYALLYPERRTMSGERVNFAKLGSISFEDPDMDTFRGLKLAYKAGNIGGSMPTVFNAANERAVSKFLNREIEYLDIVDTIEKCMDAHKLVDNPSVDQIIDIEKSVYELIESRC